MDLTGLNQTIGASAGKAQKDQGLSVQSFLASLVVYGSICAVVLIVEFTRNLSRRQQ
jgi:hypothetical protein